MAAYKKARTLSVEEAAYLAGIVDGEGTVTLTRRNIGQPRHIAISISNNELQLLHYISRITGVGSITKKCHYKSNHSLSFAYKVYNRQALDLLKAIEPFLKTYKKQRAQLAIKNYVRFTPRNGKYSSDLWVQREKFVTKFLAILPQNMKTR